MNPIRLITAVFNFFSLYEGPFEKRVDRFLNRVKRSSSGDLRKLMQEDLVRLTLFLEYKFKGYKKLKKTYRKKLYENADLIAEDFKEFYTGLHSKLQEMQQNLDLPHGLANDERFNYILGITQYLKPGHRLEYQEGATFRKLLRNPHEEKLVGDCNQITTLYIYLYSLGYPVDDLKIKLLKDHVCLHYLGTDIETTAGQITSYDDYLYLSPVEEIVATNVLDIQDPTEKNYNISPANMLQASEMAYKFSSHRDVVEKNLHAAYHNMTVHYALKKSYSRAYHFAKKVRDKALYKTVQHMEAVSLFKEEKYSKALKLFKKLGDKESEKACYQNMIQEHLKNISHCKTIADYRKHRTELKKVRSLAAAAGDKKLQRHVDDIFRQF
jgi:hypothetical protein